MTVVLAEKETSGATTAAVPPALLPEEPMGATLRPPPQWVENASCYSPVLLEDPPDAGHLTNSATPVTAFKVGYIFVHLGSALLESLDETSGPLMLTEMQVFRSFKEYFCDYLV